MAGWALTVGTKSRCGWGATIERCKDRDRAERIRLLDLEVDMSVDVAESRDQGRTMESGDREYAFCGAGCLTKFAKSPQTYKAKVDAWLAAQALGGHTAAPDVHAATHAHGDAMPTIDDGMREWYKSCRCCLSEAYPKVVEQLDAEKAGATDAG